MMKTLRMLALALLMAAPLSAQDVERLRAELDSVRTELVRARGFVRAAETQFSKTLTWLDMVRALVADTAVVPPDTIPDDLPDEPPPSDPPPDDPPGDGELVFRSTFAGGPLDGWRMNYGSQMSVGAPTCQGFSEPQVLRSGPGSLTTDLGINLAVGDAVELSFEECVTNISSGDGEYHGIYFHGGGGSEWGPDSFGFYYVRQGGGYSPMVSARAGQDPRYFQPKRGSSPIAFPQRTVVKHVVRYTRVGSNAYTLDHAVFDTQGEQLNDGSCDGYWYNCASNPLAGRTFGGTANLSRLIFGGNTGPSAEYTAVEVRVLRN